ncbi:hypothetical protein BM613_06720 [Sulfoacidibacillus thermotolerans]|uniref:HTH arsR-type domain-containing protein n=2 Tax=Sulfoacidibacillus thermotolerans TaxID=1765684 RepID=A0A2U3D9A1_SULT2|nr:hypothetical protein BM613_06720 [Sulfoacidibacillus thermotolerans]
MTNRDLMAAIFKSLADSNRLKIVEYLTTTCRSVSELAREADMSQPLTSHHLKTLRSVGIVRMEGRAAFRYY